MRFIIFVLVLLKSFYVFAYPIGRFGNEYIDSQAEARKTWIPVFINYPMNNKEPFNLNCNYELHLTDRNGKDAKVQADAVTKAFLVFDYYDFGIYANNKHYKTIHKDGVTRPGVTNKMSSSKMMVHYLKKMRPIPYSAMKIVEGPKPGEATRNPLVFVANQTDKVFTEVNVTKIVETCPSEVFDEQSVDDTMIYKRKELQQ